MGTQKINKKEITQLKSIQVNRDNLLEWILMSPLTMNESKRSPEKNSQFFACLPATPINQQQNYHSANMTP